MCRILMLMLLPFMWTVPAWAAEVEASGEPVRVLVRGGHFLGINGLMFGPDGLLWLASALSPAVAAVDSRTGMVITEYRGSEGVADPDDLAFGPDGSLYWTNILTGTVVRRSPDGLVTVISEARPGVNPITFADDGRLFVSRCFLGVELYEMDPRGESPERVITDRLGPGCGLNGMDWGPDGFLYGPRWFNGEVVRVDVDTGEFETVAAEFGVPAAVKFDSKGRLFVLDSLRGEVVRINLQDGSRSVAGKVTPSSADNLAIDGQDRVFVSSFGDGWIVEITEDGTPRTVVPGGQVNIPGGLAWVETPAGPRLFVADFFALRAIDPVSGKVRTIARDIAGVSDLGSVFTVSADGANVLISNWFEKAVRIWNPETNELITRLDGFQKPVDAVPFEGQILVSDAGSGSVLRVGPDRGADRVSVATGLKQSAGLAVSAKDAFVCDFAAGSVLQIIDRGEILATPMVVADSLQGPEGLAASEEALYVVESDGGRLTRIDRKSGEQTTLMPDLDTSELTFDGVALGSDSRLYVTGGGANTIYVLDL